LSVQFILVRRNVRGDDRLYVRQGHSGYEFLQGLYENSFPKDEEQTLDPKDFQGMTGTVLLSEDIVAFKGSLKSPIKGLLDIDENYVIW
jgi:hypothetical protein